MQTLAAVLDARPRTLSFEFFPPKNPRGERALQKALPRLLALEPDFCSVTCGAGGSGKADTTGLASRIQNGFGVPTAAHLTCVGMTAADIDAQLDEFHAHHLSGVVALRGDPPAGTARFERTAGGYGNAQELIEHIREDGRFAAIGAAYPDKHVEAYDHAADWDVLAGKFARGMRLAITQCFFAVEPYLRMLEHLRRAGVENPRVVPGILPPVDLDKLRNFCDTCGAVLPDELAARLGRHAGNKQAMRREGTTFIVDLCRRLLEAGAPGLHIYTLNRSRLPIKIVKELRHGGSL